MAEEFLIDSSFEEPIVKEKQSRMSNGLDVPWIAVNPSAINLPFAEQARQVMILNRIDILEEKVWK